MSQVIPIALLHSLSGSMELTERAVLQNALDAIDEINATGGLLGFRVEPVITDGCSSPEIFAERTLELLGKGIRFFAGGYSSVSRKSVRPLIEDAGALLFFPAPHEGFEASPSIVYTGLTLNQQLLPLFHWMKATGKKSIFHLGSDMVYQRVLGRMLRLLALESGVHFAGEFYIPEPLKDEQKEEAILEALNADTELVAVSCSGNDTARLQRLLNEHSFAQAFASLNGESYSSNTDNVFVLCTHPDASIAATGARHSIHLWRKAALVADDISPAAIRQALPGLQLDTDFGTAGLRNNLHIEQDTLIVQLTAHGKQVQHRERLSPLPYLGLEATNFELRPLAEQAMAGYADSVHLSLLLERKNQKQKEIEKELQRYQHELEDRVRERTQSLELSRQKLESEIHQRELLEEAVGESQRRFRQILEHTSLVAVVLDQRGCIVYANQTLLQKTGWKRSEIIERNWFEQFVPQRPELPEKYLAAMRSGKIKPKLEQTIRTKAGETLILRWSNTLLMEGGQEITGVVSIGEDITQQREAAEALRRSEEKLRTLFSSMTDVILVIRDDGSLDEVAPTTSDLLKQKGADAATLADFFPKEQTEFFLGSIQKALHVHQPLTVEYSLIVDGVEHWFEARISPLSANTVLFIARDATERMLAQRALHAANVELERRVKDRTKELQSANARLIELATRDELTGVANRRLFNETLDAEIRRARRDKRSLSLLFCDVDYFKKYNDRYGHQAGDECLIKIGHLLAALFRRAGELPARYGGEEFAVILPGTDAFQALLLAEKLRADVEALQIRHEESDISQWVTLSIGIVSILPRAKHTSAFFIHEADNALYRSKEEGRNRITVAEPE
ncbi:MAG: transporter substrate-binding protein [Leptonema illini]|uniref:diguanylate cyclase n=1 Tax=Leptonema illini TaxID=183 RepID=A0A833H3Z0_9LEPT|nr:MAG: transporter substrate-binding protein [Leptonema illini]